MTAVGGDSRSWGRVAMIFFALSSLRPEAAPVCRGSIAMFAIAIGLVAGRFAQDSDILRQALKNGDRTRLERSR